MLLAHVSYQRISDDDGNPQTLLFSATCPSWVYDVAKKYMRPQCVHVDLIGKKSQKAATTVEVSFKVFLQGEIFLLISSDLIVILCYHL